MPQPLSKPPKDHFEGEVRSPQERRAAGKALRERVPRESHAEWHPTKSRRDPIWR